MVRFPFRHEELVPNEKLNAVKLLVGLVRRKLHTVLGSVVAVPIVLAVFVSVMVQVCVCVCVCVCLCECACVCTCVRWHLVANISHSSVSA